MLNIFPLRSYFKCNPNARCAVTTYTVIFLNQVIPLKQCSFKNDDSIKGYSFSTYAKLSEKLRFLRNLEKYTPTCPSQGVTNVIFSENLAHVLNGSSQTKIRVA